MAWFLNQYHCEECGADWSDEWSCCCDDECPSCGSSDWSPDESKDLTFLVEKENDFFTIYRSPRAADHEPLYEQIAAAPTLAAASAYIAYKSANYWDEP